MSTAPYHEHVTTCDHHTGPNDSALSAGATACDYFVASAAAEISGAATMQDVHMSTQEMLDAVVSGNLDWLESIPTQQRGAQQGLPVRTLLLLGIERGRDVVAKCLLDEWSEPPATDADIKAALKFGATQPLLTVLIERGWPAQESLTDALETLILSDINVVYYLLQAGAKASDAVLAAAKAAKAPAATTRLLKKFAGPRDPVKNLQHAAMMGYLCVIRELLQEGIDVNAWPEEDCLGERECINSPPLHRALLFGRARPALMLLNAGADPSTKDQPGRTAFDLVENIDDPQRREQVLGVMRDVNSQST